MPPKRPLIAPADKKEGEEEVEVEVIEEPRQKKLFMADPNKQYRMTAAQWAVSPRTVLTFVLCEACIKYFKECGGNPNLLMLICDSCVLENYRNRFPTSSPLLPLPSFPRPQDWNRQNEQTKNA